MEDDEILFPRKVGLETARQLIEEITENSHRGEIEMLAGVIQGIAVRLIELTGSSAVAALFGDLSQVLLAASAPESDEAAN